MPVIVVANPKGGVASRNHVGAARFERDVEQWQPITRWLDT